MKISPCFPRCFLTAHVVKTAVCGVTKVGAAIAGKEHHCGGHGSGHGSSSGSGHGQNGKYSH